MCVSTNEQMVQWIIQSPRLQTATQTLEPRGIIIIVSTSMSPLELHNTLLSCATASVRFGI